jgi:hypothetical protein
MRCNILPGSIWCSTHPLAGFKKGDRMARNLGSIFVLTLTLLAGCGGGGSKSVSISAGGSLPLTLNLGVGLYHGVTLSAKFSDGSTPSSVSWSSSAACIGVVGPVSGPGGVTYQNEADAACSFGCGDGIYNGTITAIAGGLTGTMAISCQITN